MFFKKFVAFSLATAVVFYVVNLVFSNYLVFGNAVANYLQALIVSSVLVGFVSAVISEYGNKHNLPSNLWLLLYWGVLSLTIYIMARSQVSEAIGIGVAAFWIAFLVGGAVHLTHHHTHRLWFRK